MHAFAAGLLAAFVGFASSFAVILKGLAGVGATPAQAASGLLALSVAMGVCAILTSLRTRMPISIVWSTPGAALLATAGPQPGGFPAVVGAFVATALLIILAGLWRPLGRWVAAIPAPLASAMLAGVLLSLCLAPVRAVAELPAYGLPIVLTWAVVARFRRLFAVPAAVVVTVGIMFATAPAGPGLALWSSPVLVTPVFVPATLISLALPLFIVTMASQNVPGMAVLTLNGYGPDAGAVFRATGLSGLFAAPFGGHAVNLAAITAALCAGPDAHPDPARRYWAAVVAGLAYIALGLLAGAATAFVAASPPILIEAVAGLALLGAFSFALAGAVAASAHREAAAVTFLISASGLTLLGLGGAFWGLIAGGLLTALARWPGPQPIR